MRAIRETGLLPYDKIRVGDVEVRPVDLTCARLKRVWRLPEGEGDITVMRVLVRGNTAGKHVRDVWDLVDRYDPEMCFTSMARTTGFPCAIVARMILGRRAASRSQPPAAAHGLRNHLTSANHPASRPLPRSTSAHTAGITPLKRPSDAPRRGREDRSGIDLRGSAFTSPEPGDRRVPTPSVGRARRDPGPSR